MDDWYAETRVTKMGRSGPYTTRVPEVRQQLNAAVISFPVLRAEMGAADHALFEAYLELGEKHLRSRYGDRLLCGYLHEDEDHLHAHYLMFDPDPNVELHPAYAAKLESKRKGESGRAQNQAFKTAGKEMQRRFFLEVSAPCGFAHKGRMGRMRVSRAAVVEIKRLERLVREVGQSTAPLLIENREMKARIEELATRAQREAQARETEVTLRRSVEKALADEIRRAEVLSGQSDDMLRAGEGIVAMWRQERDARQLADASLDVAVRARREAERRLEEERRRVEALESSAAAAARVAEEEKRRSEARSAEVDELRRRLRYANSSLAEEKERVEQLMILLRKAGGGGDGSIRAPAGRIPVFSGTPVLRPAEMTRKEAVKATPLRRAGGASGAGGDQRFR